MLFLKCALLLSFALIINCKETHFVVKGIPQGDDLEQFIKENDLSYQSHVSFILNASSSFSWVLKIFSSSTLAKASFYGDS